MKFEVGGYAICIRGNRHTGTDLGQSGENYKIVSLEGEGWIQIVINGRVTDCFKERFVPTKVNKGKLKISDMLK